jgi:hypothetical protein
VTGGWNELLIGTLTSDGSTRVVFTLTSPGKYLYPWTSAQILTAAPYGGLFAIQILGPRQFSYVLPAPAGPATITDVSIGLINTVEAGTVEDNIIELSLHAVGAFQQGPPYGISFGGNFLANQMPVPIFGNLIIRGNIIRHVDGIDDPNVWKNTQAINFNNARHCIVENNVIGIDTVHDHAIGNWYVRFMTSGEVETFNNRFADGTHLKVYDYDKVQVNQELEDEIDGIILGL